MTFDRRDFLAGAAALTAFGSGLRAKAEERASPAPALTRPRAEASVERPLGSMELAILANAPSTPTGLAISTIGRIFVMMPRFNAEVPYTVGEVAADGSVSPYPDANSNRIDPANPQTSLMHVTNGVFDRDGKLWLLDAGLPDGKGPPVPGGAKLVQIDLETNGIERVVPLDPGVVPTSSLNDLRVDTGREPACAFVTDQGQNGEGAILAVDLASGRVARRLDGHASTKSQQNLVKYVEHRPVMLRSADGTSRSVQGGANGIALSPDANRLYYAPLMGRRLYAVSTKDLLDPEASDAQVAAGVEDLGEKGMTGGLAADAKDRVYLTLQEQNAVARRHPDGSIEPIGSDPRLVWADTIVITPDNWLYVSSAQVNRRPEYNGGEDQQKPPYAILRIRIDAGPA